MENLPRWLTESDIACDAGVSLSTVRRWRRHNGLRAKRLGRRFKIREDWYLAWQEKLCDTPSSQVASDNTGLQDVQAERVGTLLGSIPKPAKLGERQLALQTLQSLRRS
jgi:excisionase family DNA binding protein